MPIQRQQDVRPSQSTEQYRAVLGWFKQNRAVERQDIFHEYQLWVNVGPIYGGTRREVNQIGAHF